ncbi:MAG: PHP domain-containing protein [Spirochaetota bacterium]
MLYRADLHIHSCLSPCGSLEMSPRDIVQRAREKGLNLIAISDHNSALNVRALHDVCARYDDIDCLYVIEATSAEEVHCLCLFDDVEAASDFGEYVYKSLDAIPNNPVRFGDQVYVDADDTVLGEAKTYLGGASAFTVDELFDSVRSRGGLFVPAHVDRAAFSMSSQLGFIPHNDYTALEFSRHYFARMERNLPVESVANAEGYPAVTNSDSHYLETIGTTVIELDLEHLSIPDMVHALTNLRFTARAKDSA